MFNSLSPHGPQYTSIPVLHYLPEFAQIHVHWVGDAILPSHLCRALLLLPSMVPRIRVFSNDSALRIRWSNNWSLSFSIIPSNEYSVDFLWDWLIWSPCYSRDSQEYSTAPQIESINSLAVSLLDGAAFTPQYQFSSVQFSLSVISNSLWPHESQHARPPCPSPTPGVYSNSCPSSWWCDPAISSHVVPFSSCPQSLPASGSFPMSQLFAWGGQSIGVSASASVHPMNTQDWSSLGWTCWISLQSKGLSRVFSNTTVQKHQFFGAQLYSNLSMTTGKTIALTIWTFVSKRMFLLFNMLWGSS